MIDRVFCPVLFHDHSGVKPWFRLVQDLLHLGQRRTGERFGRETPECHGADRFTLVLQVQHGDLGAIMLAPVGDQVSQCLALHLHRASGSTGHAAERALVRKQDTHEPHVGTAGHRCDAGPGGLEKRHDRVHVEYSFYVIGQTEGNAAAGLHRRRLVLGHLVDDRPAG